LNRSRKAREEENSSASSVSEVRRHLVGREAAGKRLDAWLSTVEPTLSRARLQDLIRSGFVKVDGNPVKPSQKPAAGQIVTVEIPPPEDTDIKAESIPLDILFEDADLIVVNKPAGLVVHPAAGHASGTLVNALLAHCPDLAGIGGEKRPGIVHRLDRDTTGALVAAKNETTMRALVNQFKHREVNKEYLALVWGSLTPPAGRTETLIGRSTHDRKKMSAKPAVGRTAVTHYETIESFPGVSLVRIHIETGRTHQIRVHMAFLGHPVVGDQDYGRPRHEVLPGPLPRRQMLHARSLSFTHPRTGKPLTFEAPLPADFQTLIDQLRGKNQ